MGSICFATRSDLTSCIIGFGIFGLSLIRFCLYPTSFAGAHYLGTYISEPTDHLRNCSVSIDIPRIYWILYTFLISYCLWKFSMMIEKCLLMTVFYSFASLWILTNSWNANHYFCMECRMQYIPLAISFPGLVFLSSNVYYLMPYSHCSNDLIEVFCIILIMEIKN